jgi:hypothetical protein
MSCYSKSYVNTKFSSAKVCNTILPANSDVYKIQSTCQLEDDLKVFGSWYYIILIERPISVIYKLFRITTVGGFSGRSGLPRISYAVVFNES